MVFEPITQPEYVALIRSGGLDWPGTWVEIERLVPVAFSKAQRGLGWARFRMLPRLLIVDGQSIDAGEVTNGAYVAIAKRGSLDQIEWFGFISSMPDVRYTANDDRRGQIEAREVGNLFDQVKLKQWLTVYADGETTQRTDEPPDGNFEISSGELIGNKIIVEIDGEENPVFAGSPEQCTKSDSSYWTRAELLTHISKFTMPPDFAQIKIELTTEAETALTEVLKENFIFNNPTLRTALDALVSLDRGYTFNVSTIDEEWVITVGLSFDETEKIDIDLTEINQNALRELTIDDESGTQVDEIVLEGQPIRVMCTFENGKADTESTPLYFRKGWADAQETAYENATREERTNAEYGDVFQRFEFFDPDNNGIIKTQQAQTGQGTPVGACPEVTIDLLFGTPFADIDTQRPPYFATARLDRVLPWSLGYGKTSDQRDQQQKSQPKYSPPMIFHRSATNAVTDLTKAWPEEFNQQSIETGPDDRQLGIRINSPYNHVLGLNTISDEDGQPAIFDYRGLAFTVSFETSQLFSLSSRRPGVSQVRKQLILRGDWQLWLCHEGTIIGVDDNRDAIRTVKTGPYSVNQNIGDGVFALRDDTADIIRALTEAKRWAFRESRSGALNLTDAGFAADWAVPGASIGVIKDKVATDAIEDVPNQEEQANEIDYTVNAIVESVTVFCDAQSKESVATVINFGSRNLIGTRGFSKTIVTNPSQAQTTNDLPRTIKKIHRVMQAMPTTFGKGGGGGGSNLRLIEILDGQNLPPANINGIAYTGVALAPGADDPDVPGARPTGIGRGRYVDTGENIMILHDLNDPSGVTVAFKTGDIAFDNSIVVWDGTPYHYVLLA